MKIIVTSDLHGFLPQIPPCDLLLVGGDIVPRKEFSKKAQKEWLLRYFRPWLDSQPSSRTFFVAGNHDKALESASWAKKHFPEYLYLEYAMYQGIQLFASPYAHLGRPLAFQKTEKEIKRIFKRISPETDIILSHGPVRGVLGSKTGLDVMKQVRKVEPELFLSGHIHNGFGFQQVGPTLFLGASLCSARKVPAHPLWAIEWNGGISSFCQVDPAFVDSSAVPERVRSGKT